MKKRRFNHETNTGMFADISFLLLIFFMVVTTFNKAYQVPMKLPPLQENLPPGKINKSRVLSIHLNDLSQILIEDKLYTKEEPYTLKDELRRICTNTQKDLVSIKMHPDTPYAQYVRLLATLKEDKANLQEELAQELYGKPLGRLNQQQTSEIIQRTKYSVTEKEINNEEITTKY